MKLRGTTLIKGSTKWRAQIRIKGQTIYIGTFETQTEAHDAFCQVYEFTYGRPYGEKQSIGKAIEKARSLK